MEIVLLLLFFTPLAFVFGRRRALRARRAMAAGERTLPPQMARMLLGPALVLGCAWMAAVEYGWLGEAKQALYDVALGGSGEEMVVTTFYTGNPVFDFFVWCALAFGLAMLVLFFASIPYVLGSVMAVVLLLTDRSGLVSIAEPESGARKDAGNPGDEFGERPL